MRKTELKELYKMMFPDYPDIVTVAQLQQMLGVSRHLAYDLINNGYISGVKIGNAFKIPKVNVINYVMEEGVKNVSALKNISDKYGIAVLVVHHVRKLKDVSDPFNEVSGSTGITGAADTNFVLKRSRANETGTLLATGRDIAYQELTLKFDNRSHLWELVERKDMEDIHREEIPKFVFRLVDYILEHKEWRGTATQLITQMNETEVTPNVVTKMLARFSSEVFQPQGIEYKTKRTGTSRLIYLKKNDGNDGDDNKSAI